MVDQKSPTYRPRRAFIEPDAEPAKPNQPAGPAHGNGTPNQPAGPAHGNGKSIQAPVFEDNPKPLYRDEARSNGWSAGAARPAAVPRAERPTDQTARSTTSAPQRTRVFDEETTAILPRSRQAQHRSHTPPDAIHDYDEDERNPLGRRTKLALLIGGVAVVVVIGLLVGYAVLSAANQRQNQPGGGPPPGGTGTSGNASQPSDQPGAALSDASMLSPDQAKTLAGDRTWKVVLTQLNPPEDAPTAACFGGEPPEGQPTPQQEILRALSSGKNGPTVLHQATAYNSSDEASQAFKSASLTLGGCAVAGSYIESGRSVSGLGNEAVGVVVKVVDGTKSQAHSVVLNRTGRVMNVVDAVQPSKESKALAITAVAKALQQVNSVQCGPAAGECRGTPAVKDAPPPTGGDVRGFLATGDLPPAGPKPAAWVATEIAPPKDIDGSQCENVNWKTIQAESKEARTYLIQDTGFFGLDEIVMRTKDAKAAKKQVDSIKSNLTGCKKRTPTATVSTKKVTSIGEKDIKVAGWTAVVSQKSTGPTHKYRVGIVAAGSKVVYTFLNPKADYDFSGDQWDTVAVRAGERATQVN